MNINTSTTTELGELELAFTSGDHVSVTGILTVREVKYNIHFHFYLKDGKWLPECAPHISGTYDNLNQRNWGKYPAPTISEKINTVVVSAVRNFISNNPDVVRAAEQNHLEKEIESAQTEINNLINKLAAEQAKLAGLQEKLDNLDFVLSKTH